MTPRLRNKSYEDRHKELDLYPLTKRILRGGLIKVCKIFKGFANVKPENLFTVHQSSLTRNSGFKKHAQRFVTIEATNRIVNIWNELPANVVSSNTIRSP